MDILSGILASAVGAGTVIVIAALGELMAERTGVMNLGLEGVMSMGAVTGVIAANAIHTNSWGAHIMATAFGLIMGSIFALATVVFKANQILAGLALSYLGTGLSRRIGVTVSGTPTAAAARWFDPSLR